MTIDNVSGGELIDPVWGNAVADQLNNLPLAIQAGSHSATVDGSGDISVTYPTAFGSTPIVVCTPRLGTSTQRTGIIVASTSTGFTVRMTNNDTLDTTTTYTINWIAVGAY